MATLLQLNIKPRVPGEYGLPKVAVDRLEVSVNGAAGDYNNYRMRTLKGDPDQAIMLLTEEVIQQLRSEGWPVQPADFGENITLGGVAESDLGVGTQIEAGDLLLEISKPCDPCTELGILPYVGQERRTEFIRTTKGRRGWYARVLRPGVITVATPLVIRPSLLPSRTS